VAVGVAELEVVEVEEVEEVEEELVVVLVDDCDVADAVFASPGLDIARVPL
jgi:hypothetical protein